MVLIELVIKDVPNDEGVIAEIKNNSMTTISNFLLRQVPKSKEQEDAEKAIEIIKSKNITAVAIEPEPIKEIL